MFARSPFNPTLAPFVLLLAAGCSKDEPAAKPTSDIAAAAASAEPPAKVSVEPAIGGKVFLVGRHQCELAVYADGRVEGLVMETSGVAVAPERVRDFSAALSAEADARPRVKLLWDAEAKRFRGQADAKVTLTTRPIDVTLQLDDNAQSGVLEGYVLLPAPALEAKGEAKAKVEAESTLEAPEASAKLGASAKTLADAKVRTPQIKAPNAAASLQARAAAKASVPQPKLDVGAKASASTDTKKPAAGASVKAKASFGF
jgi:hypothetical protein